MKDFGNIKQLLEEKGEIKTKDIKDLGYSQYDINQFMASNLLERKERGIYTFPREKETAIPSHQNDNIKNICGEGTYNLVKKYYYEASKKFQEILKIDSNHSYANKAMALISTAKDDLESAYNYLLISLNNNKNENYIANYYLYMLILSKVIEIPSSLIAELKTKAYKMFNDTENNYFKYFRRIEYSIINDNLDKAATIVYYLIKNDRNRRKYNIDNNFMYLIISKVNMKLHNEISNEAVPTPYQENIPTIIVPDVEDTQVLNNALLLKYITEDNFDSARELLKENAISNQNEVIEVLLSKLILLSKQDASKPVKVTNTEEAIVISKKSLDESVEENILPKNSSNTSFATDSKIQSQTADSIYQQYKDNYDSFQFDEARRSLTRYELLIRQSGNYRNIKYHYDRIEADKKDYSTNRETYIKIIELKRIILSLIASRKYEEALEYAEEILKYNLTNPYAKITIAKLNNALGNYKQAYDILIPLLGTCEEPEFFFQLATACYELKDYNNALEYCINYNERRPNRSGAVYVLMAKCYNKMRKFSKELKALLKADKINTTNGKNIDLSQSIERAENKANRQHEFILAKINGKLDYEY